MATNLPNSYDEAKEEFEWANAWKAFSGDREEFNMGYEAIGKHNSNMNPIRVIDFGDGSVQEFTYKSIANQANKFANFLEASGLKGDEKVAAMMEPRKELYSTIFGTWLSGNVYVPLYTLFGADATNYRLEDSEARILVTTSKHIEKIDTEIDTLDTILVLESDNHFDFDNISEYSERYQPTSTPPATVSTLQYTSGTTGPPKGVEIIHGAVFTMYPYGKYAAAIRNDDTFFGVAPPAWAYGLIYCTAYVFHLGVPAITYRGEFNPEIFLDVVEEYQVTNLFAPATGFQVLSQLDEDFEKRNLESIRTVYSGGGPVSSKVVRWGEEVLGTGILDHYGFTEGGIFVNNYAFDQWDIKPGSMGKPSPGFNVKVMELSENVPVDTGETGELSLRQGTGPLDATGWAAGYIDDYEGAEEKFVGEWLRSGDLVRIDEDGYFWHEGRTDDIIISSGYRIGPTEIEDVLVDLENVAEAAVVGLPDEKRGEAVAAFIVPTKKIGDKNTFTEKVQKHIKETLGKHQYPRRVELVNELPQTATGKIQRYKLIEKYS